MRSLLPLLSLALVGCVGALGDAAAGPRGEPTPVTPVSPEVCATQIQPGTSPFRRLTRDEFDATVLDLLGDDSRPAQAFPADEDGLGFAVGATVSPLLAELYLRTSEDIAARAVRDLDALLPCDPASGEEACARRFIETFGRRAYRRHLEPARVDRLMEVYRVGAEERGDFAGGIRLVLTAMLQSPFFLYRVELGAPDLAAGETAIPLTMDERASRLSYFLWGTMPDATLFAAADAGELETTEQIREHARRMLLDPRARTTLETFAMSWLELELEGTAKDDAVYPQWSTELGHDMEESTRLFVDHVVFESSGTLAELFTADYAFVNGPLAEIYGVEGVSGDAFVRVDVDPTQRAGLLTQPSLLSMHARTNQSSPVFRGRFIRERLFCQTLPPPPEDLVVVPPEPDPSSSTRTRYEEHRTNPACAGCHQLMDPLGFPLEHYDGIGRYRERDEGFAVDARGSIAGTSATDGEVDGALALAHALAESPDVQRCLTDQMWQFAFRRTLIADDACSIGEVRDSFDASGGDIRELLVSIAVTDAFLYRRASAEEVSP